MSSDPSHDRPLSGAANLALLAGATAAMLLFYFFILCSVLLLLVVLAFEFVLLIALLRFGMAGFFIPVVQRHGALLLIFFKSMGRGKAVELRIPIKREDCPELHAVLKRICAGAQVPLPNKVVVEMGVNAWVMMKGYRRGAGMTTLGMGFDLLAGLSQTEMEGVLAHEMMHAKLVQRGFRQLLTTAVGRAARLTGGLANQIAVQRRAKQSDPLAGLFLQGAHNLTRLAARQVAACSRQDEFDADRGAAQLCGAGAIRSSLLKLEGLGRVAARLQWRERIAQLETGQGFSEWLVNELGKANLSTPAEAKAEPFNKYSTHPSLYDRLAALAQFPDQTLADSPPALGLLADPDSVAEKLVKIIQKKMIQQEQEDTKQLDRWNRKFGSTRNLQPLQGLALFVILIGIAFGFSMLANLSAGTIALLGVAAVLTIVGGIALFRFGRYREKVHLPVPDYSLIKTVSLKKVEVKQEEVMVIEGELRQRGEQERNRKARLAFFLAESHRTLERCEYVRAHIAARFCLEQDAKSIPGTLALCVAAGGIKNGLQVGRAIHFIRVHTGMRGASAAWGAGWALSLVGDWIHAEAFLDQARALKPNEPTVLAMLAISQVRRGKLFSAIESARKACQPQPRNKEYVKLLIDLLLQGGFLREAHEQIVPLVPEAMEDTELMLSLVKLSLLQRNEDVAEQWAELIRQSPDGPLKFVKLGETYEAARLDARAEEHFQHALTVGHYPEALLGLGRLETHRQNKDQARLHLLAALDVLRPLGENSVGPLPLVVPILQQLKLLQDPVQNCRGWVAAFPANVKPVALANRAFLIYAPNGEEAKKSLNTMLQAMQPDVPPPAANWKSAPREQQPDGPVHAGIQAVLN
jgi:heat shock protein HtpX